MAGELLIDRPADGVLRLTISNPAKRNALDHAILDGIAGRAARRRRRPLRASSPAPTACSPRATTSATSPTDVFAEEAEKLVAHPFTAALDALDACDVPTVAALPGHTIGGGLELALACDLRVAADGIQLGMPPAKLGLVYSHTGLRRFIDAIGAPRTRELFLARPQHRRAHGADLGPRQRGRRRRATSRSEALDWRRGARRQRAAERARQQARDPRAAGRRGRASTPTSSAS